MIILIRSNLLIVPLLLCSCSTLPGLQIKTPGSTVGSGTISRTVAPGEDLIEVTDESSPIKTVRVLALTPEVLRQEKAAVLGPTVNQVGLMELSSSRPIDYQIGPGDVLGIVVWDHPELTNPAGERADATTSGRVVGGEGNIFYPYIGNFKAAGMSLPQLRAYIAEKLKKVITDPQVDVSVMAFRSQHVQVTGEVGKPGQLSLDNVPKTLMQVLAESGGVSTVGSKRRAWLYRGDQQYEIDLAALYSGSKPGFNPVVLPGDRIHVPERYDDQIFVLGQVIREGPVYLNQQRTSLIEVLAQSGGLEKLSSNARNVLIFRKPEPGQQVATVIRADLTNVLGLLAAGELPMRPRDVVYVSTTGIGKVNLLINNLLPSISTIFQLDALVNRSR